jgi:citrate lyase subunit beta / citryl-CoA lyase
MRLRSLLFVPADRPERFAKAVASKADAIILDLEDSVAHERKGFGRDAATEWLAGPRDCSVLVRINPLDSPHAADDLAAILPAAPDGLVLPKADGAGSVELLMALAGGSPVPPVLPIALETPGGVFGLASFSTVGPNLCGLTWGAEDLSTALGAASARDGEARFNPPFAMARNMALFAARAAGVQAIETVYPAIGDLAGLATSVAQAKRDGFTGMLAIHPAQVPVINEGLSPTGAELERAQAIVDAFAANPGAGALQLDGRMIDRPHLVLALDTLARAG